MMAPLRVTPSKTDWRLRKSYHDGSCYIRGGNTVAAFEESTSRSGDSVKSCKAIHALVAACNAVFGSP